MKKVIFMKPKFINKFINDDKAKLIAKQNSEGNDSLKLFSMNGYDADLHNQYIKSVGRMGDETKRAQILRYFEGQKYHWLCSVCTKEVKVHIDMNENSKVYDFPRIWDAKKNPIDYENISPSTFRQIKRDMELIEQKSMARAEHQEITVGDYLVLKNKNKSRVTYILEDGTIQDGGGRGSFFLWGSGKGSYSGSLDDPKRLKCRLLEKRERAEFWIFSNDWSGADRGIYFEIDVKVWKEI